MIFGPLTDELMRERIARMFDKVIASNGPIEEIIFEILRCDGCDLTINLVHTGGSVPDGWTTEGEFDGGWTDWCPRCSKLASIFEQRDPLCQSGEAGSSGSTPVP